MRKNYNLMAILFVVFCFASISKLSAQNYAILGNLTTATPSSNLDTGPSLYGSYYTGNRNQILYLASDLQAIGMTSGNIASIGFNLAALPGLSTFQGFTIQIKSTTLSSLTNNWETGLSTVFNGNVNPTVGWNQYPFSAPFVWDGVSNIVVQVCWENGAYSLPNGSMYYTLTSYNSNIHEFADNQNGCTLASTNSYDQNYRPDTRFEYTSLVNDAGVSSLLSPSMPSCVLDSVVDMSLLNSGTGDLTSCTVNWSVNGTTQTPYVWTGTLTTGSQDTLTLGTVVGGISNGDEILIWVNSVNGLPQDSNSINDTLSQVLAASLNGNYVIDQTVGQGDYNSFTEAINAMAVYGICGPVIFDVVNGTYVEQIVLEDYYGMSDTNTVTFRSQLGNPSGVNLTYNSTNAVDNYVVKIHNADNFKFESLTITNLGTSYSYGVNLSDAQNISFDNCIVHSSGTSNDAVAVRGYGGDFTNLAISNCTLEGGYYNLYLRGGSTDLSKDILLDNNMCVNTARYSIYVDFATDIVVRNNYLTSDSTVSSGYGIYMDDLVGGTLMNNYVFGNMGWPKYGLYVQYSTGNPNESIRVFNNRVFIPNTNAKYGICLKDSEFGNVSFNSVYLVGYSSTRGIYINDGSYNEVLNNSSVVVGTGGIALKIGSSSAVFRVDNNNLSAINGNIGYLGSDYATLADWQLATGFDSNSINVNFPYSDSSTLAVCSDSLFEKGKALASYLVDFEGDPRQTIPCIGADEFIPTAQFGNFNNSVLCNGDTLELSQYYFDTVVWNTTDTSNTYLVTNPGSNTVAIYDQCGSDTATIVVDPQVIVSLSDTNLCEGSSATLNTGISGGTYMWSNDVNSNTYTDSVVTVDSAMTVYVEVVDMHGCSSMDTAIVTQSMDVVLDDSVSFCEGANVVLDANMQGTYLWSDGSTNQTLSVTSSGTYSVTVTDQNCVSSASSNVSEILNAIASFSASSSLYTAVFTNTSQNGVSYLWNFGDGTTSTYENPTHAFPNTNEDSLCYVVTLEVTNSCGSATYTDYCVRAGKLINPLSVSEVELASLISVYPNPNAGIFTVNVKSDESKDMSIEVLDVRGAQVFVQSYGKINGEVNRTVNLEGVAQGIYFVKVTLDGETAVYRISVN